MIKLIINCFDEEKQDDLLNQIKDIVKYIPKENVSVEINSEKRFTVICKGYIIPCISFVDRGKGFTDKFNLGNAYDFTVTTNKSDENEEENNLTSVSDVIIESQHQLVGCKDFIDNKIVIWKGDDPNKDIGGIVVGLESRYKPIVSFRENFFVKH